MKYFAVIIPFLFVLQGLAPSVVNSSIFDDIEIQGEFSDSETERESGRNGSEALPDTDEESNDFFTFHSSAIEYFITQKFHKILGIDREIYTHPDSEGPFRPPELIA